MPSSVCLRAHWSRTSGVFASSDCSSCLQQLSPHRCHWCNPLLLQCAGTVTHANRCVSWPPHRQDQSPHEPSLLCCLHLCSRCSCPGQRLCTHPSPPQHQRTEASPDPQAIPAWPQDSDTPGSTAAATRTSAGLCHPSDRGRTCKQRADASSAEQFTFISSYS